MPPPHCSVVSFFCFPGIASPHFPHSPLATWPHLSTLGPALFLPAILSSLPFKVEFNTTSFLVLSLTYLGRVHYFRCNGPIVDHSTFAFIFIIILWLCIFYIYIYISVQFSCSAMSYSLRPHGLQHAWFPCPSPTPRACSNLCPLSQWCNPTISPSVIPFSSCLQSFPASGSFPMS